MIDIAKLTELAVAYDAGDPRRVQHLMKVYAFCRIIGQSEGLDEKTQNTLEAAAILHDIGIHEAEHKHGSSAGKWQEVEGPAVAALLLKRADADPAACERVLWLIAHHHTYTASDDKDFRILLEADFLVNAYEDTLPPDACQVADEQIFRTHTGRTFLQNLYLTPPYQP
ncbi:MAG TPA: HD domain-containing protein [Candidatus Agathobaculum pullicola]|nr:HD domain-containing protein [Candidatus Agathobaculum pullicola]